MKILPVAYVLACSATFAAPVVPPPLWATDVQVRLRIESRANNFDFNSAATAITDDAWLLTRVRLGLKGKLSDTVSLYAQAQDSREFLSDRVRVPFIAGSEGDDPADLRQLYLDFKSPDSTLRVGRQAITLGDERLVGASEWNNFARAFDAVRLTLPNVGTSLDLFAASVVQAQPTATTGWHSNHSSLDDIFLGIYSHFTVDDALKVEPYVFYREKKIDTLYNAGAAGTARPFDLPQKITTLGLRWIGGPAEKLGGFDYDGEFAWQTGSVRGRQGAVFPGPAWLSHEAWALHAGAGYTTKSPGWPLRFYAEYNHATGDRDPNDTTDQSFLNLFPTNHKFYGVMDVFAWKNMSEVALTSTGTFNARWKARAEHHFFALANTNDTWFRANAITTVRALTPAARAASRTAGEETDLVITCTLNPHVTVEAGGAYFAAGSYLAQTGAASNATFGYLQTTFSY